MDQQSEKKAKKRMIIACTTGVYVLNKLHKVVHCAHTEMGGGGREKQKERERERETGDREGERDPPPLAPSAEGRQVCQ
jgi:hypothetical protein